MNTNNIEEKDNIINYIIMLDNKIDNLEKTIKKIQNIDTSYNQTNVFNISIICMIICIYVCQTITNIMTPLQLTQP